MLQSLFVCRRLLTGGTVIPVSLIAVVPTVLEKSVFYGYLAVASVSLGLPTQFIHCCLAATRAFMPASLIVIPYTILEISKFLGQFVFVISPYSLQFSKFLFFVSVVPLWNSLPSPVVNASSLNSFKYCLKNSFFS